MDSCSQCVDCGQHFRSVPVCGEPADTESKEGAAGSCHCLRCDVFRLYGLPVGVAGRALMNEADGLMVAWLLFAMLFVLAAFAIVVTYAVFAFISLYYVYKSCNPRHSSGLFGPLHCDSGDDAFLPAGGPELGPGMPPGGRSPSLCRRLRRMWSQPGKNLRKPRRRSLRGTSQEL